MIKPRRHPRLSSFAGLSALVFLAVPSGCGGEDVCYQSSVYFSACTDDPASSPDSPVHDPAPCEGVTACEASCFLDAPCFEVRLLFSANATLIAAAKPLRDCVESCRTNP